MDRKIKLIWDLRGINDVLKTAQDHGENIKYFAQTSKLHFYEIGAELVSRNYAICFVIVDEKDMITYRDGVKPHRAIVAK